jgi:hypothetical protein
MLVLPKDKLAKPLHPAYMNMSSLTSIHNFTTIAADRMDTFAGTLSPATLQCILGYTTQPRDIVLSFNVESGEIFNATENYSRMVFGTKCPLEHFGNNAAGLVVALRTTTKVNLESEEEITPARTKKGKLHVCHVSFS